MEEPSGVASDSSSSSSSSSSSGSDSDCSDSEDGDSGQESITAKKKRRKSDNESTRNRKMIRRDVSIYINFVDFFFFLSLQLCYANVHRTLTRGCKTNVPFQYCHQQQPHESTCSIFGFLISRMCMFSSYQLLNILLFTLVCL